MSRTSPSFCSALCATPGPPSAGGGAGGGGGRGGGGGGGVGGVAGGGREGGLAAAGIGERTLGSVRWIDGPGTMPSRGRAKRLPCRALRILSRIPFLARACPALMHDDRPAPQRRRARPHPERFRLP